MATEPLLVKPCRALAAFLHGKWLQRRARRRTPHDGRISA
jgi:hypothetical protein